ncbi:MAG TPA: hypothetical protein VD926_14440 [Acidimicrobiales bacterium]|nr:hypothetical protein [Acidimicrobiales bacterium]
MLLSSRFHAVTWLCWAVAAAATVQLAPSPVYVVLVIAIAALVVEVHRLDTALARAFPALVALGVIFALLRVVLTGLTTHGVGDVAFTLPEGTLPRILGGFTVGGSVEWPVVLQSAAEGLAIVGVLAVFGAFNAVVSHYELVQATPRAFHEPGLAVTVALAFVPSTMLAVQQARDADRARAGGVPPRRGRLVRRAVPVLESGMERAVHLAESMDSRGFARTRAGRPERVAGWLGVLSLLALGGSFVALVGRARPTAVALALVGVAALVGAVVSASRGSRLRRYRPRRMTSLDWWLAAVVAVAPAGVGLFALLDAGDLTWTAQPLEFPSFVPGVGLVIAILAAPALVRPMHVAERP